MLEAISNGLVTKGLLIVGSQDSDVDLSHEDSAKVLS